MKTLTLALVSLVSLISCSEDGYIPLQEFQKLVETEAGMNAQNCGHITINESVEAANQCVADSFILNVSFYSTKAEIGEDSIVANGVSMNVEGRVIYWLYDSDTSGGNNDSSKVTKRVCISPTINTNLTHDFISALNCQKFENI